MPPFTKHHTIKIKPYLAQIRPNQNSIWFSLSSVISVPSSIWTFRSSGLYSLRKGLYNDYVRRNVPATSKSCGVFPSFAFNIQPSPKLKSFVRYGHVQVSKYLTRGFSRFRFQWSKSFWCLLQGMLYIYICMTIKGLFNVNPDHRFFSISLSFSMYRCLTI